MQQLYAATRRSLLMGLGTIGMNATLGRRVRAQGKPRGAQRVDVHYHIAPPAWSDLLTRRSIMQPAWNGWSPQKAVEDMDRDGVKLSIVSITTPGVWYGNVEQARTLARQCNDFAAKMREDYKGRFGIFAAIPLPDTDGSLREIAYALDELKADGIGLLTSYGDKWLGDPAFDPVFAELNRRNALVYTHPTVADCCRNLSIGLAPPIIEYGTDTTRAIGNIVFNGAALRFPHVRYIFSHAGGTMPFLYERFAMQARSPEIQKKLPLGVDPILRRFYYDTAQAAMAPPMAALKRVVPVSQILFGTDYPYRTAAEHVEELHASKVFTAKELAAIEHENAARLLAKAA